MDDLEELRIQALAAQLLQLRTGAQIAAFRRGLDAETAKAVISAVPALERGMISLCLNFRDENRFGRHAGYWDSGIEIDSYPEPTDDPA
jgi:hypothetical protein